MMRMMMTEMTPMPCGKSAVVLDIELTNGRSFRLRLEEVDQEPLAAIDTDEAGSRTRISIIDGADLPVSNKTRKDLLAALEKREVVQP